jgi:hypothetical protein
VPRIVSELVTVRAAGTHDADADGAPSISPALLAYGATSGETDASGHRAGDRAGIGD